MRVFERQGLREKETGKGGMEAGHRGRELVGEKNPEGSFAWTRVRDTSETPNYLVFWGPLEPLTSG